MATRNFVLPLRIFSILFARSFGDTKRCAIFDKSPVKFTLSFKNCANTGMRNCQPLLPVDLLGVFVVQSYHDIKIIAIFGKRC